MTRKTKDNMIRHTKKTMEKDKKNKNGKYLSKRIKKESGKMKDIQLDFSVINLMEPYLVYF